MLFKGDINDKISNVAKYNIKSKQKVKMKEMKENKINNNTIE